MRHDLHKRAGSSILGLLLLVHLGAGLLHPCCLGGSEHAGGAHAMDVPVAGEHAGAHTPVPDEASPTHGSEHDKNGCEGACGLCCQTVDQGIASFAGSASVAKVPHERAEAQRVPAMIALPAPDFFLPLANAPPGSSTLLG